jgi:hypothetical protein
MIFSLYLYAGVFIVLADGPIGPVPPVSIPIAFPFTGSGTVGILATLRTASGLQCYDAGFVNLGPGGASAQEARRAIERKVQELRK